MPVSERYRWFKGHLHRALKSGVEEGQEGKGISHSSFEGITTSGKTYLVHWFAEYGILEKFIKFSHLWIPDMDRLEEALTFSISTDIDMNNLNAWEKYDPKDWLKSTKVHLYIPISAHISDVPKELSRKIKPFHFPNNDRVEVFFYDIPCDSLGKHSFQILYGGRDASRAYDEYSTAVRKGITFSDLKYKLSRTRFQPISLTSKGFGNTIEAVKFHGSSAFPAISSLLNRLNTFTDEGILNSSRSPYSLPKIFRKNGEWKDQKSIVLLYTGFLKDEYMKIFCLVNFIETQMEIMSAIKHRIGFKAVNYINEAGVLFPKQRDKYYRGVHQALTSFARWFMPQSRHTKIEVWMDYQHFDMVDDNVTNQIQNRYITRFHDDIGIEKMASMFSIGKDTLRRIWNEWYEEKKYRFFISTMIPPITWNDSKGKAQLGFELPRPKLSYDGKISFVKFIDLGDNLTDFKFIWDAYKEMLSESELKIIERIKDERKKAKAEREKRKLTQSKACSDTIFKLNINPDDIKKMEKDELSGLIDRIKEQVSVDYEIEVSTPSVKRALGLWK